MSIVKVDLVRIAGRLRKLARETVDTAMGSSRIEMYRAIADQLDEQAEDLETLAKDMQ